MMEGATLDNGVVRSSRMRSMIQPLMQAQTVAAADLDRWKPAIFLGLLLLSGIYLLFRDMGIYAIPAGDEVQYSLMARYFPYSADWLPSYIFNLIYSSTRFCGTQFYACAKTLNVMFFVGTAAIVFWCCRLFANWSVSVLAALVFVLSPLNVYTSFFMAEIAFAAGAWVILYHFLSRERPWEIKDAVFAGGAIALLCMIKAHGIFLGAIYVAATIWLSVSTGAWRTRRAISYFCIFAVVFFAVRLGIGFAMAGRPGLSLLGTSYTATAQRKGFGAYLHVVQQAALPFTNNVLAIVVLAGLPLCMALFYTFRIRAAKNSPVQRMAVFATIFFAGMIVVVSLFTSIAVGPASETLDRVHLRYYDYYLVLLYMIPAFELARTDQPPRWKAVLVAIPVFTIAVLAAIYLPGRFQQGLIDNPDLHGLFFSEKAFILYAIVNGALIPIWLVNARFAAMLFLCLQMPFALGLQTKLLTRDLRGFIQFHNEYPRAGMIARYIWGLPGPDFFVAGTVSTEGYHSMFYLDRLAHLIELPEGAVLRRSALPPNVVHGIIIGKHDADFAYHTDFADDNITILHFNSEASK